MIALSAIFPLFYLAFSINVPIARSLTTISFSNSPSNDLTCKLEDGITRLSMRPFKSNRAKR